MFRDSCIRGGGAGTKGKSFPYSVVYMYVQNKVGTLQSRKMVKGSEQFTTLQEYFNLLGGLSYHSLTNTLQLSADCWLWP